MDQKVRTFAFCTRMSFIAYAEADILIQLYLLFNDFFPLNFPLSFFHIFAIIMAYRNIDELANFLCSSSAAQLCSSFIHFTVDVVPVRAINGDHSLKLINNKIGLCDILI